MIFCVPIWIFGYHGNQSNLAFRTRFMWLAENYSRNISIKRLSKYLQIPIRLEQKHKYSFPCL